MFVQYINLSREKCAGCIYETVSHHPPPPPPTGYERATVSGDADNF
jgi:hypothetical protein